MTAYIYILTNGSYNKIREIHGSLNYIKKEVKYIQQLTEQEISYKLIYNTVN